MPESFDKKSILIVDDEASIVRLFKVLLTTAFPGLEIDTAENGAQAVSLFEKKRHNVVLMDLHMPVLDGQAAFWKIEGICRRMDWDLPPVVFCTGFAPPGSVKALVGQDPRHCLLSKPVTGKALVEAVGSRLS